MTNPETHHRVTRVLLLDDKEERGDLALLLSANDYEITVETDGEVGLDLFRQNNNSISSPADCPLLALD